MKRVLTILFFLSLFSVTVRGDVFQTTDKPPKPKVERNVVPPADSAFPDWKRAPYVETAPEIVPTDEEKRLGMILFSRPLVDAIYPETRPRAAERIQSVSGFGAWNQYETLNFALYPLVDLTGIRVTVGDLRCGDAVIPASQIEVRLVTYRDNTYPQYSSKGALRRLPEYLQNVTVSDAPALEPQRFCITIQVPEGLAGGHYRGNILVSHDRYDRAVQIPVDYEVLPFLPKRDPNKHFSAYYYSPERHELVTTKKHDLEWARDVQRREFATMVKYGFTRPPVLSLGYEEVEGKRQFCFKNDEFLLNLIKENKMQGPLLMVGGSVTWVYTKMTGKEIGNHIAISTLPGKEYYDEINRMAADFKKVMEEKKYPPMVFGPLDEISGNDKSITYGRDIYDAFKRAGLVTYTTMEPENAGFQRMDPVIDIFGTQAYLPVYEEIVKGHKLAYWCYPNHNSYERKDTIIMNKGGRMTYGFGYWRSGFNMLVPWIWRNNTPKHFFEKRGSGGANILHPETGDLIMTIYWENFREGINDLNYVYTLQDAIVRRENSTDPAVVREITAAKKLLQEIWDSIDVQVKYLAEDLWPSDEFDGRRRQLGDAILRLEKFPATNEKTAPSVLIEPRIIEHKKDSPEDIYQKELKRGNIEKYILADEKGKNLGWTKAEDEATVELEENLPGAKHAKTVLLNFNIDTVKDGTGNKSGSYPAGWPAMNFFAKSPQPKLGDYDLLYVRYKLDSNRANDGQPKTADFYYSIRYQNKAPGSFTLSPRLKLKEGQWTEKVYKLGGQFYDGIGVDDSAFTSMRAGLSESNYQHGDQLHFRFDEIAFVRFKKPFIASVDIPKVVPAATERIRFSAKIMGPASDEFQLRATYLSKGEKQGASKPVFARLADKKGVGQLNLPSIRSGSQGVVKLELVDQKGHTVSETSEKVLFE